MTPRTFLVTLAFSLGIAVPGLAHEFWVEPEEFQVESAAPLVAQLRNGQEFKGGTLAYFAKRTARFELIQGDTVTKIEGRMGDIPALSTTAPDDGLLVILHETEASTLKWSEWEKFVKFAEHKKFADVPARHTARGLPESGFIEAYWRYAKALVAVGSGVGADHPTGMETEFVALTNPYTDPPENGVSVRLLYQNQPRAGAQVEVFDRSPDQTVAISYLQTDDQGQVTVPVTPGHTYLLDGVVLRDPPEGSEAAWETHWAALTFQVPK